MRALSAVLFPEGVALHVFEICHESGRKIWRYHSQMCIYLMQKDSWIPLVKQIGEREAIALQNKTGTRHTYRDDVKDGDIADVSDVELLAEAILVIETTPKVSRPCAFPENWAEPGERFPSSLLGPTSRLPYTKRK